MAPSPTAEATRFIESSRTSPAANTPGTLVSSANGTRGSGHRPRPGGRQQVVAGDDEPLVVAGDVEGRATGCGASPDERTASSTAPPRWLGVPVGQRQRLEVAVAPARHHLAAIPDGDVGRGGDPLHQVPRHRVGERGGADDQHHPPGEAGQVERGLAGQLAAPTT